MSKTVAVLWSGGLDSTYLVYKNLKDGNKVLPIYVTITQNDVKTKMELHAIERISIMLRDEFGSNLLELHKAMDIRVSLDNSLNMVQPPIWMLGVIMSPLTRVEEVHVGYIMKDDALSYLDELRELFNTYKAFMYDECHKVNLLFPIIKEHKTTLVRKLPKKYLDLTVWCEHTTILDTPTEDGRIHEDCGHCDPCKTLKFWNVFHRWERNSGRYGESMDGRESMKADSEPSDPNQLIIPFPEYLDDLEAELEEEIEAHHEQHMSEDAIEIGG